MQAAQRAAARAPLHRGVCVLRHADGRLHVAPAIAETEKIGEQPADVLAGRDVPDFPKAEREDASHELHVLRGRLVPARVVEVDDEAGAVLAQPSEGLVERGRELNGQGLLSPAAVALHVIGVGVECELDRAVDADDADVLSERGRVAERRCRVSVAGGQQQGCGAKGKPPRLGGWASPAR